LLPGLRGCRAGTVEAFDADRIAADSDAVFCALPHGASAPAVAALRSRGVPVFDLSADFRISDRAVHAEWYGSHGAEELSGSAIYGCPELHRDAIRGANLVAVPGCYPTASILALAPVLGHGLAVPGSTPIIDAKSGVSGAGRSPTAATHLPEATGGIRAYKVGGVHRHIPEIEQELTRVAGSPIRVVFTPHLVPMTRGILATCYVPAHSGATAADCSAAARDLYGASPSVIVLEDGAAPDTLWVRGSNRLMISYTLDARAGVLVVQSVLDNLVKGAAGQAIQCMNLRMGLDEALGLTAPAVWP
jgi:N-acetyl-gamma-glutamyl-phosphate reductase